MPARVSTIAPSIQDGVTPTALNKVGGGLLSIATGNTYSGATTVNGGVLQVGAANSLSPNSDVSVGTNGTPGTLDVTAGPQTVKSLTVGAVGTLNLAVGNPVTSSNAASFNGTLNVSNVGGVSQGQATELTPLISYSSYSGVFSSATALPVGESLVYSSTALDIASTPTWVAAAWYGDWNLASNWSAGIVPNSAGAHAVFNNNTGSAQLPATNVPVTLGIIDIIGTSSTTITGVQGRA